MSNNPYLIDVKTIIKEEKKYNPDYGDNRICVCGHAYHRHFDPYEDMKNVGCKYCPCNDFTEYKANDRKHFFIKIKYGNSTRISIEIFAYEINQLSDNILYVDGNLMNLGPYSIITNITKNGEKND